MSEDCIFDFCINDAVKQNKNLKIVLYDSVRNIVCGGNGYLYKDFVEPYFFKLLVNSKGNISRVSHDNVVTKYPSKKLIGVIRDSVIKTHPANFGTIGCLVNFLCDVTLPISSLRNTLKIYCTNENPKYANMISPRRFELLRNLSEEFNLNLLENSLDVNSYLFSRTDSKTSVYYSLEGCIRKIEGLTTNK